MSFIVMLYVQLCCVQLIKKERKKKLGLVLADRHLPDFSNSLANSLQNCKVFTLPPSNSNLFSSISAAAAAAFCLHVYRLPSISLPSPSFIFSSQGGLLAMGRPIHV